MRIEFKRIEKEYFTESGLKVPFELICGNPHDLLPNGSGWVEVDLPFFVGPNVPEGEEGSVKLLGFGSAPVIKRGDGSYIVAPGLKDPTRKLTIPDQSTSPHVTHPRPNTFTLPSPDQSQEIINVTPANRLEEFGDTNDVFPLTSPKLLQEMLELSKYYENNLFLTEKEMNIHNLKGFGFDPRPNKDGSVHMWYHPIFGDDKRENWLLFDPETDTIQSLIVKVFRQGARLGTRALKLQIKNTLESH